MRAPPCPRCLPNSWTSASKVQDCEYCHVQVHTSLLLAFLESLEHILYYIIHVALEVNTCYSIGICILSCPLFNGTCTVLLACLDLTYMYVLERLTLAIILTRKRF